jgi:BED zinc finger
MDSNLNMDTDNINEDNSEDEVDTSQPATPARRLSDLGSLGQSNQGSYVWNYFKKDEHFKDNKKATCILCNKTYVCSGSSTTNISKHLKVVHSIQRGTQPTGPNVAEILINSQRVYIIFIFIFSFTTFVIY